MQIFDDDEFFRQRKADEIQSLRRMADGFFICDLVPPSIAVHLPRPAKADERDHVIAYLRSTAGPDPLSQIGEADAWQGWKNEKGRIVPPPGIELRILIGEELFTPDELRQALGKAEAVS